MTFQMPSGLNRKCLKLALKIRGLTTATTTPWPRGVARRESQCRDFRLNSLHSELADASLCKCIFDNTGKKNPFSTGPVVSFAVSKYPHPCLLLKSGTAMPRSTTQLLHGVNILDQHKRHRSEDSKDSTDLEEDVLSPSRKIEKQLMTFMDLWEMKKAIKLLRLAVENNIIPHQTVILNLLQQLANLGEVDFLVDMHQFLLDEKLVTNTSFYTSLQQAYFNSGRIDEGIDFLRKIYHLTRKYQDIDTYFVLLTVMILRHFPDKECMVTQFVKDLGERVPEDHEVRAALWKCYLLTQNFEKGDKLVEGFTNEMKPFVPIMVNDIINRRNKVDVNRALVLKYLLDFPGLSRKQQGLVYQTCLSQLVEEGEYREGLEVLDKARTQDVAMKRDQVLPLLRVLEMAAPSMENESYSLKLEEVQDWIVTR